MINAVFQIFGLMDILLIAGVYFSKQRLKNYENRVYKKIILLNILGQLLHIGCYFTIINAAKYPLLNTIVTKLYLVYLVTWLICNVIYICIIAFFKNSDTEEKKKKKYNYICCILFLILVASIFIISYSTINYINDSDGIYTYGPAVDYVYDFSTVFVIISIIIISLRFKNIDKKKIIPMISFMVIGGITMVIQKLNPSLLLFTNVETFITLLMYFTIENPDVKMIEQLEIAREEADKANQAKSDFLSSMSHEIRTPLNAIVGFSQALEEEDLPESARDEVSDIISASESLLEIVNGILDISKIEANKLDIINDEYNFRKLFHDLVMLTKARMGEDSKLDFQFSMDESIPGVLYGDHARVKQVILNLLTNAVKYTKEGYLRFRVDSVIKDDICRLIISVEDSGIGIKQENINKLFSKFERLGVEKEITIEGTGLGLAITKKLVDLMNGKIVVQSVYGKGSKFTIALDQKIVLGKEDVKEEAPQELRIIDCSSKKILIVDDNNVNLKVAMRLLRDYKINIETSDSGFDCLNKIKQGNTYDLILMDDMMPKMSGTETFHKLKEDSSFNTPVVILTANAITGMKEKYLSEGFNDYLAKPIDKLALNEVIIKFLEQK